MSELRQRLVAQSRQPDHIGQDARDCVAIYDWLLENTGEVRSSQWYAITSVRWIDGNRAHYLNFLGRAILQTIKTPSIQ